MSLPDLINGCFEAGGTLAVLASIQRLRRDREVKGVAWFMVAFFTTWGYWNTFYYSHLDQWFSWSAGIVLASVNTVYLWMLIHYTRDPKPPGRY